VNGDAFGFFTLIEKLATALLGQLPSYKKTPKQWVARELVRLFDILSEAQRNFAELSRLIYKCETAETKEGKIYFLFEAGKVLRRLGDTCSRFLEFQGTPAQIANAFKLLAPEIKDLLAEIEHGELPFEKAVIEKQLNLSRRAFQAVAHPDPERLPSAEMLQELQDQLQSLSARCDEALGRLRHFASAELRVEDFF
jgi:hypothetical protein